MADIELRNSDTDADRLPEVCMACGGPSITHIRKTFSWYPPWVGITILAGVLPFAIIAMVLTKRMRVEVPVCERHRGYWWKRYMLMWIPLLVLALFGIGAMIAASNAGKVIGDWVGFACVGSAGLGLIWLITAAVIQSMMIRPREITDRTITLRNVSVGFADAFADFRRASRRDFDRDYDDGVDDYDDRMRRRRERQADRRSGYADEKREKYRAEDAPDERERYRARDSDEPPDERIRGDKD
ncbi:MAG: hypothetical protein ACJ8F7_10875 [Gemmataceae bacterium]